MKRVLVEGWRGIHQSLAMVNQFQLVELAKIEDLYLRHDDIPFSVAGWASPENLPGFPSGIESAIANLPGPSVGEAFDAVYRIAMPFAQSAVSAKKRVTFMVSEFGLRAYQFAEQYRDVAQFCRGGDIVVTPSNWSKMKLVEFGIPEDGIHVVPHGVSSDCFFPLSGAERLSIRGELEYSADEFVFLNVSSLTLEKGVDILLQAFSIVRQRHPRARLILKDTSGLYGLTLEGFLQQYVEHFGPLARDVLESIGQVPSRLTLAEMRMLYGAADAYVSPYRAEGFNLPVIEAIACGTPAIVTRGGATDDFFDGRTARQLESDRVSNSDRQFFGNEQLAGYHLEPRVDSLVEQMEKALTESVANQSSFEEGRRYLVERFSWAAAAKRLTTIFSD